MIFDPATAPQLKPWLVRTLEPICDAEPGALADYILALVKHNVPETEMRKELQAQLDEFLENECASFVDTLFTVLRTKSYLPYAPPSPPPQNPKTHDTGIPIPLDGLISPSIPSSSDTRPRKRSIEPDDRDVRPPAKGPRLNSDTQFSRYGNNGRQDGRWNDRGDRPRDNYREGGSDGYRGPNGGMTHTNGRQPQSYQPPDQKRGVCRDYYNYGYCGRGALCKFSHGDDAVVPGQFFPPMAPGMPFLPIFPNGAFGPAVAYDPHESRMDMRPRASHQRTPLLPRVQQEDGSHVVQPINVTGELPVIQDLTPSLPRGSQQEQQGSSSEQQQQSQSQATPQTMPEGFDQNSFAMAMAGMNGFQNMGMGMDIGLGAASMDMNMTPRGSRPQRGRGTFSGEAHHFRPQRHTGTTLVVEKIPNEKLSLELVNEWFKRFGTVTNVAIDAMNAKALVSFGKHEEAHAAWKSEDAVFNNRFVKVFWHRPMEGHGQVGARLLAASAPLVASMQTKEAPTNAPPTAVTAARKPTAASAAATLSVRQKLLEEQIAEQKSLMGQLDTASVEQKKGILARLRKLGEEMKPVETTTAGATTATGTVAAITTNATATATTTPSTSSTPAKRATSTPTEDRERLMREKLDRELEMHNASVLMESTVIGGAGESGGGGSDSMDELKTKLEKLKAEAASLGISDAANSSSGGGGGGGYRGGWSRGGRGGGRGARSYYRGASPMRGGGPARSMKLDNRPKRLLVKGAKEDHVQGVREWYNATGQVESVETAESGELVVSFRSRPAAEQGLAKGTNIPNVGPVQLSWYTGTTSTPAAATVSSTRASAQLENDTVSSSGYHHDSHHPISLPHEEEVVASGWGDDDGDGMGMI
ncbi:hypothetical protein M378DRAFT_183592 [Amanita muscaria Koide BX008]|uniref:C3H1-type domain-containing protein n=1 Tax=Amanita muscaria (strain Koide BX008) TaxID=946122 RepID=A0A0C2X9N6_AMAMK|nr:hypothetical protein M378DRAFT_183592 [Amanita muscaria Koide BX008]